MSYISYSSTTGDKILHNDDGTTTILSSGTNIQDRAKQTDINNIDAQYRPLIEQQKALNAAREAGTNVEGLVSGRTRYAPTIQSGVLGGVVQEGLNSILDIINRRNAAVSTAVQAREDRDYKALQDAIKAKADAEKDTRDYALRLKEFALKEQDANFKKLESAGGVVAGSIAGLTPEASDAYINSYAKTHGLDPNELKGSIKNFNDEKYKSVDTTIYGIAKDFPGIVTDQDIVGHDIASVLKKIPQSATYKLDMRKKLADALKAEADLNPLGSAASSIAVAAEWAKTGKMPAGLKGAERDVIYEAAKQWAQNNIADGAIVDKADGFLIPPADLSAASEQSVAASAGFIKAASEITDFLKSKTTYPGGRGAAKAGQLVALTDEETAKFNALRDNLTAAFVQSVSGVAVNEAEYKRLTKLIPNSNEWNKYAIAKWDTFMDQAKRKTTSILEQRNATLKGVDLRTEQQIRDDIAKAKKDANLQSGQRLIQAADGNTYVIDANDPLEPGDIVL